MVDRASLWRFAKAYPQQLLAAMSGGFSVPFAGLAVFSDSKYAQLIFASLAFAGTWFAAYTLWKIEHDKVAALEGLGKGGLIFERNISVSDAVGYVAFREWGNRFIHVISASAPMVKAGIAYDQFLQSIADGKIPIWGKRQEGGVHEPIPHDYWFENRIDFKDLMLDHASSEPIEGQFKGSCYQSLMTSREAVERYWPRVGDTGPRAVSALQISFGMDDAYKSANTRNLHQYERILSFKLINRGPKTLSECRVVINSVDVKTGITFPLVLAKDIKLAPGDYAFVPLVSYGEPMKMEIGDTGDTFTVLLTSQPKPFFDVRENVLMNLRATGVDTLPHDTQCRVWVNANGRLAIQGE